MNTNTDHLLTSIQGGVLYLTLNRPERLNAFSPEMIAAMAEALADAQENKEVRVIVLSGAGRSFSSGGDVKTMGSKSPVLTYEHIGRLNKLIVKIKEIEKPVIAAVHGFAAGAGANLALACDLVIASDDSKFAFSFSQVGLVSDGGGSYFLPKLVGPHLAKELLFSAEPIPSERLYTMGAINRIVPVDSLKSETEAYAAKLAHGPGRAYGMIKKLVDHSFTATLDEILEQERITQTMMMATEDHHEGVNAFKEKRKPVFTGN